MDISKQDRMFVYLWSEDDTECKFGQRWVPAGEDAYKNCGERIRQSLGVRKDKFDIVKTRGYEIWDVSRFAQDIGKFHNKSKVDDHIRKFIGFRKGTSGEVHTLPHDKMFLKVSKFLNDQNVEPIVAGLSTGQYNAAVDICKAFEEGKKIVLAELCARFGKTIWSGAVAVEQDIELVIVASYVQTVFTSFAGDLIRLAQLREYEHIDTKEEDYEDQINNAFSKGKKVFVYLSLGNGSLRQERIDRLFAMQRRRMVIVDEADYGAHRPKQSIPLVSATKPEDKIIIMTGTNADRAVGSWKVDHIMSTTYFELLTHKAEYFAENA